MLHPVRSDPARHDEPCGGAVPVRQRLAIHLESDERVFVERALDGQALQEIRRRGQYRGIGTVEHHFQRVGRHAGSLQHIAQPHAPPQRVAHRTTAPLYPRHSRREESAPIAGALIDRGHADLLEAAAQLSQGQSERVLGARAGDLQPPGARIHPWNDRQVIAHEKRVVARERRREIRERRLEVGWPEGAPDERFLAGQGRERVGRVAQGRLARPYPLEQPATCGAEQQLTPCHHVSTRR